jgi:hypothetical protein
MGHVSDSDIESTERMDTVVDETEVSGTPTTLPSRSMRDTQEFVDDAPTLRTMPAAHFVEAELPRYRKRPGGA